MWSSEQPIQINNYELIIGIQSPGRYTLGAFFNSRNDVLAVALVAAGNIFSTTLESAINLMEILVVGKIGRAATAAGNAQNQVKSKKQKVKRIHNTMHKVVQ